MMNQEMTHSGVKGMKWKHRKMKKKHFLPLIPNKKPNKMILKKFKKKKKKHNLASNVNLSSVFVQKKPEVNRKLQTLRVTDADFKRAFDEYTSKHASSGASAINGGSNVAINNVLNSSINDIHKR